LCVFNFCFMILLSFFHEITLERYVRVKDMWYLLGGRREAVLQSRNGL
jgi:hypothetical protein